MLKVAINGYGRIGRLVHRQFVDHFGSDVEVVAINASSDAQTRGYLLKYDSVLGNLDATTKAGENQIDVNGEKFVVFSERDPGKIDWASVGAEIVVESTGLFTSREHASKHLHDTVKKVIISAPAKNEDITLVLGVNERNYNPKEHHVISNASCTTNCLAPIAKVLDDNFTIKSGLMTTVHAYTNDQQLLDLPHKDLRRARAAALSIIPTSTGAAKAIGLVLPHLKGKLDGISLRVPTPNVSVVDLVAAVEKEASKEAINAAMKKAADGPMRGILAYSEEQLVSTDFRRNSHSSILDAEYANVLDGKLVKLLSWYDNEWGYSCRVVDLIKFIAERQ